MNANVDQITQQLDLKELEKLLQNITYARLDREDIEDVGTDNLLKLFRLAQMSVEYLIYTQNYLECLTRALDMQYKNAYE
jgi:zinc finger protein DZIP1